MADTTPVCFNGQVAIVTGAGAGMGASHAVELGKRGARIIVNDLFDDAANSTVTTIRAAGGKAIAIAGNISDPKTAEQIVSAALKEYGRIDILVNNAGIEIKKFFDEFTDADIRRMMEIHFFASWNLTNLVWPHMKKQGYGRVLVVCSHSLFGMAQNAAYVSAKGALFGMMKALAQEGPKFGIHVNALAPIAATGLARQMTIAEQHAFMEANYPIWPVSQVLAWIVHQDCQINGDVVAAYGSTFGRIFLAETKGVAMADKDFTAESVRDRFEEAFNPDGYLAPPSMDLLLPDLLQLRAQALQQMIGLAD